VKDGDIQHTVLYLRALPYALIAAGLVVGPALMVGTPLWRALIYAAVAFVIGLVVPVWVSERGGGFASKIYNASGSSTPPVREYSLAESLIARGQLSEAAEAYRLLAEDYPNDPEPATRRARLLRDKLKQYDISADWFKRALAVPEIEPQKEIALLRELCELYTHKLNAAPRALPFLARLTEKHPASPAAAWAREEYAEIKKSMQVDQDG
jgi:hypothetical protein